MYGFLTVLQVLVGIGFLVLVGIVAYDRFAVKSSGRWRLRVTEKLLRRGGVIEEGIDAREAALDNLQALGLPSVDAGDVITGVPMLNPEKPVAGWKVDQEVLVTARAIQYMSQGPIPQDMIELTSHYMIVVVANRTFLMKRYAMTRAEEAYLQEQRQVAVGKSPPGGPTDEPLMIEGFLGQDWEIRSAAGEIPDPVTGRLRQSTLQVLSYSDNLWKQGGYPSTLPRGIFDGKPHPYFDVKAIGKRTGEALLAFYCAGVWSCYIGRELSEGERAALQGL
ncbi:MAG: hypothetical protein ACUVTZ_07185 [Armatimonadota bacterium]